MKRGLAAAVLPFSLWQAGCGQSRSALIAEPLVSFENGEAVLLLPASLQEFVERYFHDYEIPDERAFSTEMLAALRKDDPNFVPFYCKGDFNGDARPDVVLMLREKRVGRRKPASPLSTNIGRVVVFFCDPEGAFEAKTVTDFAHFNMPMEVFVRTVKTPEGKPDMIGVEYWRAEAEVFGCDRNGCRKVAE